MDKQITLLELFPETFGKKVEVKKRESQNEEKLALEPRLYWQYSLEVVNAWAKYQAVKKLRNNASHPDTRPAVQKVIDDKKYYNGSFYRLRRREEECYGRLYTLMKEYKEICGLYKVEPVGFDWLRHNLKNAKDYASYRCKCERRRDAEKQPVSLKRL